MAGGAYAIIAVGKLGSQNGQHQFWLINRILSCPSLRQLFGLADLKVHSLQKTYYRILAVTISTSLGWDYAKSWQSPGNDDRVAQTKALNVWQRPGCAGLWPTQLWHEGALR